MRKVEVDEFVIDRGPVTVAEFARFAEETGHVTVAERAPDPADYPDADPSLLVEGSARVRSDIRAGAARTIRGLLVVDAGTHPAKSSALPAASPQRQLRALRILPARRTSPTRMRQGFAGVGGQGALYRAGMGVRRAWRKRCAIFRLGSRYAHRRGADGQLLAGATFPGATPARRDGAGTTPVGLFPA